MSHHQEASVCAPFFKEEPSGVKTSLTTGQSDKSDLVKCHILFSALETSSSVPPYHIKLVLQKDPEHPHCMMPKKSNEHRHSMTQQVFTPSATQELLRLCVLQVRLF